MTVIEFLRWLLNRRKRSKQLVRWSGDGGQPSLCCISLSEGAVAKIPWINEIRPFSINIQVIKSNKQVFLHLRYPNYSPSFAWIINEAFRSLLKALWSSTLIVIDHLTDCFTCCFLPKKLPWFPKHFEIAPRQRRFCHINTHLCTSPCNRRELERVMFGKAKNKTGIQITNTLKHSSLSS